MLIGQKSIQIFYFEAGFPAILVCLGIAIAPDSGRTVYDPFSYKFRIMPDFQAFQPVAAMEYPFSNVAHILGKPYIFQVIAFEKGTVLQGFQ